MGIVAAEPARCIRRRGIAVCETAGRSLRDGRAASGGVGFVVDVGRRAVDDERETQGAPRPQDLPGPRHGPISIARPIRAGQADDRWADAFRRLIAARECEAGLLGVRAIEDDRMADDPTQGGAGSGGEGLRGGLLVLGLAQADLHQLV